MKVDPASFSGPAAASEVVINLASNDASKCASDLATLTTAAQLLQQGQLVAMPTETVYGLAADALNPEAVRRIFAAKRRPR